MLAVRPLRVVTMLSALSACAENAPSAPVQLPLLPSAVWHVNTSDAQAMPALLGHRLLAGNVLEQDFLDSAQFEIFVDGSWEHRGWYERFRASEPYQKATTLDWGTWTATTEAYEFRRNTGELLYTVPGPSGDLWHLNLRYPGQDGVAVSQLRPTRPPVGVVGRYEATAMQDQPLPRTYIVEPEFHNGTTLVSHHVIIDSAFVSIYPTGRYRHRIHFSHWEGPVGGAPEVRLIELTNNDFGTWVIAGDQVTLQSGWVQNHVILGERLTSETGPLRLHHGITHGDEPVPLRYVRQ